MRLNSIRARMTAAFTLSIALLMLCACGGLARYARYTAERNADALLIAALQQMQTELSNEWHLGHLDHLIHEEQENLQPQNIALFLVDPSGRILRQTQRDVPAWPRTNDDGWRVMTAPAGPLTIVVGLPWHQTDHHLKSQATGLAALGVFVVLIAAIGAWILVGRTLSPIGALSRQAQAASAESLRVSLETPSQDSEVVELVTTLNGLLSRLSETAAAKGRFHAAASHELRTPLQALSGHLELALHRPRAAEEYQAVVEEAQQQTKRLISLARDLLLLNQLDSAPAPPKEPINLTETCERALCHFAALIESRALQVTTDLPTEALIEAPPTHIEMLIRNLIENALKYASPGGKVHLRLDIAPESTRLRLFNECPPLLEQDMNRLFEPFYRPDASRNSKTGGTGLGLAICKALATVNGWNITLEQETEGVEVIVRF